MLFLRAAIIGVAAAAAVAVAGCGGAPPEILFADAQLYLTGGSGSGDATESLRLYVAVRDSDGVEDLSRIWVIHDESELYWQASAEDWVVVDHAGDSWIGLPDLRPPSRAIFPRGRYRVVVEDGALQQAEGEFSITAPAVSPQSVIFPYLDGSGPAPAVVSAEPVVIRVYSRAGKLVTSREVTPGSLSDDLLREVPAESGLQVFLSSRPGEATRLFSGPFELPR